MTELNVPATVSVIILIVAVMTLGSPLGTPLPRLAATGTILRTASGAFGLGAGVGAGGTAVGGSAVGAGATGAVVAAAAGWVGAVVGAGVEASHATTNRPTASNTNNMRFKLIVVYLLLKEQVERDHAAPGF